MRVLPLRGRGRCRRGYRLARARRVLAWSGRHRRRWRLSRSLRGLERGWPPRSPASRDGVRRPSPAEIPSRKLLDDLGERVVRTRDVAVPFLRVPDLQPVVYARDGHVAPQARVAGELSGDQNPTLPVERGLESHREEHPRKLASPGREVRVGLYVGLERRPLLRREREQTPVHPLGHDDPTLEIGAETRREGHAPFLVQRVLVLP